MARVLLLLGLFSLLGPGPARAMRLNRWDQIKRAPQYVAWRIKQPIKAFIDRNLPLLDRAKSPSRKKESSPRWFKFGKLIDEISEGTSCYTRPNRRARNFNMAGIVIMSSTVVPSMLGYLKVLPAEWAMAGVIVSVGVGTGILMATSLEIDRQDKDRYRGDWSPRKFR